MPGEIEEMISAEEDNSAAPQSGGFVLADGDIAIFKLLYDFRFLRRDQLSVLTKRPATRLHRRLFKLIRRRYLNVLQLPQQKHIYTLGKAAVAVLVEQGIAEADVLAQRIRVHELKELFLKHEMMIVEIHVALTTAASRFRPVAWQEGRGLFDSVIVTNKDGSRRLPIRPDAFFTIEDRRRPPGAHLVNFFLEADRSTTTQARFEEKIIAYWEYLRQALHTKKHGIKSFRVLTVTLTQERAENLCARAAAVLPEGARKYYLFTPRENFSKRNPSSVFDTIYLSPRTAAAGARYPLIPAPAGSQTDPPVV